MVKNAVRRKDVNLRVADRVEAWAVLSLDYAIAA
jgi:hypothetical protein